MGFWMTLGERLKHDVGSALEPFLQQKQEIDKYKKVQEYMLTLSDEELDNIAHAFQDVNFEKISTTELVKALVKVSPKALLKLGKFI